MGIGLYVLLLCMCIKNIHRPCNSTKDKTPETLSENIPQELIVRFQVNDPAGIVDPKVTGKLDSVISEINEWNRYREECLNQHMGDLKPEANNEIEKQNTLQESVINLQIKKSAGKVGLESTDKLDSAISIINEWNKYREECFNQHMGCLRQETNNVIEKQNTHQDLSINFQINKSAGKVVPKVTYNLDSIISLINEWNKYREKSLDQRMSDLRQETNNLIEKQNAWLSFWIGILAIVGALIPALLQMRNERRIDSEIDRIKKQQDEIEELRLPIVISQLSSTLISIVDNVRFINSTDRSKYVNEVHDDLCNRTEFFFNSVKTNNDLYNIDGNNSITCLRNIILQLFAAYNACHQLLQGRSGTRQLSKLVNSIRVVLDIIEKIINSNGQHDGNQRQALRDALDGLLVQMKKFRV